MCTSLGFKSLRVLSRVPLRHSGAAGGGGAGGGGGGGAGGGGGGGGGLVVASIMIVGGSSLGSYSLCFILTLFVSNRYLRRNT